MKQGICHDSEVIESQANACDGLERESFEKKPPTVQEEAGLEYKVQVQCRVKT